MKSANTVWMTDISTVLLIDYSVWYKGQQIGYMKSDKSCIDPFYDEIYNNLKSFTSPKKEIKREKEATFAARLISISSLLDTESDVKIGRGLLRSGSTQ